MLKSAVSVDETGPRGFSSWSWSFSVHGFVRLRCACRFYGEQCQTEWSLFWRPWIRGHAVACMESTEEVRSRAHLHGAPEGGIRTHAPAVDARNWSGRKKPSMAV